MADESYPEDLKYHAEHDWARIEGDEATLGVTWFAQDALGELVHFEPPEVGASIAKDGVYGEVDMNLLDGSSVWLQSVVQLIAEFPSAAVTLLLRVPRRRDLLTAPLGTLKSVTVLDPPTERRALKSAAKSPTARLASTRPPTSKARSSASS